MKRFPIKSIVAACAIALASSPLIATAAGDPPSDLWAKASLTTTYTLNRHLNPFDIEAEVNEGVATLRGTVESAVERDLAEELARGIDGITEVNNELMVDVDVPRHLSQAGEGTERSFTRRVEDANLTAKVKSQLLWHRTTGGLAINVDTRNTRVTLSGNVDSQAEAELAEQIALNTHEVSSVDNQLTVGGAEATLAGKAEAKSKEVAKQVSDGWITAKVKSALLYNRNVDGSDIDVDTKEGVVSLHGQVDSDFERELAISISNSVKGVKSVTAQLSTGS
uniref:BON domain-containing protein n=1 Tax=Marinobacterium profundum TaxID=1714300 RepID=UPI0008345C59|nr:BON domain-containing protein [Marinobacterium profundum]